MNQTPALAGVSAVGDFVADLHQVLPIVYYIQIFTTTQLAFNTSTLKSKHFLLTGTSSSSFSSSSLLHVVTFIDTLLFLN